ncbi:MAG: hypothetical protein RLZZ455_975, partial [Candidatus Parcubacteria bacterium]
VDKRFERVQHEAYFISIDPARQTGSDKGDWEKAIHELARRRVLVMPRAVPGGGTPPPEPPGVPEPPEPVMTPPEPPEPPEPAPVVDPGAPEPPDAPEPAPAPPVPATPEQVIRDFLIVNRQADLEGHSVLQARQMLRAEMRKGGWNPLRWPKKFGLRLTEKMWEQRISTHLREQMIAHNNSYLDLDLARSSISGLDFFRRGVSHMVVNADSRREAAHAAGVAKVAETRLRGEAGMGRQIHENIGGPVKDRIIADILRPIADGSLPANTDERRAEVQRRLRAIIHDNRADAAVQEIFGESGRGMEFVASDLLETGQMLRSDVMANRFALDQMDQHVRISLANPTSWGAETEMQNLGFSDKAISWLQKRRSTGAFGDSTIMGAAVSLGIYGIGLGGRRIGSSVAARGASSIGVLPVSAIGGSIVGAALAGFRRNYELKVDRATYLTEGAYEMQAAPHARRREKLGEYNYDTVNAAMLLEGGGGELRDGRTRDSLNMLLGADLTSTGGKEALINRVAEIKTRLDLSSQNNIDLITFSGKENVEQGRLALVQGIVRANAALRAAGMTSAEITAMEATAVTSWQERLSEHRTMQDKAFRNYRIRQSLIAGGIGGVAGLGGAMISQEIATHVLNGNFAPSAIERIAGKMGILSTGKALAEMPGNGESIDLGNGLHGTIRGDHIINLVDGNGKSLNIPLQYVDGKVIAQGDYADLPDSVKDAFTGWEHSSVGGSSLREQIRDAVGTTGSDKIRLSGDATLQLDGRELSLFDAKGNLLAHGTVDSGSGEITFDTTNDKALAILEKNGFSVSDISEGATESLRANVSGFIKEIPDDITKRYDLGFVKMDIDGHDTHGMHNVVIRDEDGAMLAKGRISEEGVLKIDMGRNPGVTQAELQPTLNNLRKIGFSVDTKNHGVIEGKPDLRIWEEHGEDINHYEWYAYDTPYSEANELQMHTFKDGDTLILDMGSMGSAYQTGVEPNPILVPEVISDKQAGFAFSLPGHTEKPIFILDSADGTADGQLRLDPNDNDHWIDDEHTMTIGQFTKLIINQEKLGELPDGDIATELYGHQDVFMLRDNDQPGFINAGRIDDREGGKVFQSFATIRGSGRAVTPKDIITITPPSERMGIVMTAPGATEFRLPGVVEAPAIATPFFPRLPLELLMPPIRGPYYYGGAAGEYGLLSRSEYASRRSRTLNENPDAHLDQEAEVNDYLSRQDGSYIAELEEMDRLDGTAMSEQCRLVFAVPAYEEGGNIRKTLDHFLTQQDSAGSALNPDLYEIVILDNHPESKPADSTRAEVEAFKAANPNIHVVYAHKAWKGSEAGVGNARKYANDLALLRSRKRSASTGELVLVSNDADLDGIANKYVVDMLESFDTSPSLDAVAAKWSLPREALAKPNLRAAQRLWFVLDRIIQQDAEGDTSVRQLRTPGLIGRNAAFRASAYAAVGGYNPQAKLAEDLEIGWMINDARGWDPSRMRYNNKAELISNPRRFLAAMVQGVPLIQMYGDFHENTAVRSMDNAELLNALPNTFDPAVFEREADALYQAAKVQGGQYSHLGERFDLLFRKTMGLMGAEYDVVDATDSDGQVRPHVRITNADRLIRGLSRPIPPINP